MNYTFCQGIGVRPGALRSGAAWLSAVLLLSCPALTASAAMLLGDGDGNDMRDDVIEVIDDFNTANGTDLTTDITLFKKTDDDADFVFDTDNGFMFFEDEDGNDMITDPDDFNEADLKMAWFKYDGPANLLYYSVKGGDVFNVWTFMPGMLNKIQAPINPANNMPFGISHVSFWVPEPTSMSLVGVALLSVAGMARRRRS